MMSQTLTRAWRRSSRFGEQIARVHLLLVRTGPVNEIVLHAVAQHDFGDPRYYAWSGWDDEQAFDEGRAQPFDLVVGPPRPPFRATAFTTSARLTQAIAVSDDALASARAEHAGNAINRIDLFHPVIIAGGPVLAMDGNGVLTPVTWCRLERHRIAAADPQWVDIVRDSAFAQMRESLFAVYGCLLQRLRCLPAAA